MKKKIITSFAAVCICYAAVAQQRAGTTTVAPQNNETFQQYFTIGPRVGINISNISGVDKADSKVGLLAGGFFVYSFQEHFGISADLLYSAEGAKFENTISTGNLTVKTKNDIALNYLRVPLQAAVFFGQYGNRLRPKVTLGPSIGFLLGAKNKLESVTIYPDGSNVSIDHKTDYKENIKGVDFGAVVGAGLNYRLVEAVWWNFDVRYYIGASDINNKPVVLGNDALKNNGLSVSLGLGIGL